MDANNEQFYSPSKEVFHSGEKSLNMWHQVLLLATFPKISTKIGEWRSDSLKKTNKKPVGFSWKQMGIQAENDRKYYLTKKYTL